MNLWISVFVLVLMLFYHIFYEYPSLNERMQASADEDEKSNIMIAIEKTIIRCAVILIVVVFVIVMKIWL